ncbi:MAG TPA: aldo/keto reductase [Rhizomicrobium sp.]|nr:aldo/keto reductase [Rhizomicrobium sp.]
MGKPRPAELVLGSVQLGLAYGAANRTGKPSREAALSLVRRAADAGISTFDTARCYGDSEERLGEAFAGRKPIRAITKLSPLTDLPPNATKEEVRNAVDASIVQSLLALQRKHLDCLLLHRASHIKAFGGAIWNRVVEHYKAGTVRALGVSVQNPAEVFMVLEHREVQHIQLPFNLFDWRWKERGVTSRLKAHHDITVHARSVFLQGILATRDPSVWPDIEGVNAEELVHLIGKLAREFGRESPADLCMAYARAQDWIDGVVIGMETEAQLDANLRLSVKPPLSMEDRAWLETMLPRVPERLLDPARWAGG